MTITSEIILNIALIMPAVAVITFGAIATKVVNNIAKRKIKKFKEDNPHININESSLF